MCPKGDDPLTLNQDYRAISLAIKKTNAGTSFSGTLHIDFEGVLVPILLTHASLNTACSTAFSTPPKFSSASCSCTKTSSIFWRCDITFLAWPYMPYENNMFSHSGYPEASEFACDISATLSDVYCAFSDIDSKLYVRGKFAFVV